jgi:hypothetical protein
LTRTVTRTATATIPRPVGPEILAFGIATADNHVRTPVGQTDDGVPIYDFPNNSGFIIFVEGRPGTSSRPLSACGSGGCAGGALQLIANRPLGNGSPAVCDTTPPFIGGVPAVPSLMFDSSQQVLDAINDLACRFESFNPPTAQSPSGCTLDELGNFKFVASPRSTLQYCNIQVVGAEIAFPSGLTRLKVQLRDGAGNIGSQAQIAVSVP